MGSQRFKENVLYQCVRMAVIRTNAELNVIKIKFPLIKYSVAHPVVGVVAEL